MEFLKIVGSGNDFVVIDNRKAEITRRNLLAQKLCNRKLGVGADGLLLLENSKRADFIMRIFNPDGSEAEMCGNGLRCIVRYIQEKKLLQKKKKITIETKAGIHEAESGTERIKVQMFVIGNPKLHIQIPTDGAIITGYCINTGVPHTVIMVKNVGKIDVKTLGPEVRFHRRFKPRGTNVDWVEIVDGKNIKVRTYERGVEEETLSCGTGVVAGAIISFLLGKTSPPVNVVTASKEKLKVFFSKNLENIFLEGKSAYVFKGTIG